MAVWQAMVATHYAATGLQIDDVDRSDKIGMAWFSHAIAQMPTTNLQTLELYIEFASYGPRADAALGSPGWYELVKQFIAFTRRAQHVEKLALHLYPQLSHLSALDQAKTSALYFILGRLTWFSEFSSLPIEYQIELLPKLTVLDVSCHSA